MARATITPIVAPGSYPTAWTDLTWTAGDSVNGHKVVSSGNDLIIAKNVNVAAKTVTLVSIADEYNRTGDLTKSMAQNGLAVIGPIKTKGWKQTDGNLYIDVNIDTDVSIAVIALG